MGAPTTCRICDGPLELLHAGSGAEAHADAFSPTNHQPGQHGDLYRCGRCGTVAQPSLPGGDKLLDLYRRMRDDHYLDEEAGRRATARRLLDAIATRAPSGRLLDVGCGHGLLLDEARKRGYDVRGLELSEHASAYAQDRLDLPVERAALEDQEGEGDYAAIVLADVLEHLADPLRAIEQCGRLLTAGGVLCIVTPDPGSRTARVAGPRWWGFLPAHTFLLPRATLRRVLDDAGLDIADDLPLVRTFTLRYWTAGLAERGGAIGRVAEAARKLVPSRATLSLSLGDERVVIARRGARYETVAGVRAASSSASSAVTEAAPA